MNARLQSALREAASSHPERHAPEYLRDDEAEATWQADHQADIEQDMVQSIQMGWDKYCLGDKLSEVDSTDLFKLMTMALHDKGDELVAAVKRHALKLVEVAAELQAITDAEKGGFEAFCRKQAEGNGSVE